MILFVTPRTGKPPGSISVTDLALFYVCPRRFLYRRIFGQKRTRGMIRGLRAHAQRYAEHAKRSVVKIPLGTAIELALQGERLVGREVEVWGNGLYGIMDEVLLHGSSAIVVDYKASVSETGKVQVMGYAYALRSLGVEDVVVKLARTDDGRVLWEERFDESWFRFIDALRKRLLMAARECVFPGPSDPSACAGCPFWRLCRAGSTR